MTTVRGIGRPAAGAFARLLLALTAIVSLHTVRAGTPALAEAARSIVGPDQGVYVEAADGTVLVAQAAAKPVHPASVSKVATSLALLEKFGPGHRFATRFSWSAPVEEGVLRGDLVVSGDGDPSFVDEDALLIARRLNALDIRHIAGTLRVAGPLTFDWQPDPVGARLRLGLSGRTPDAAWAAVREVALESGKLAGDARPAVTFDGADWAAPHIAPAALNASDAAGAADSRAAAADVRAAAGDVRAAASDPHALVYRSQPLISLMKGLNDYSNNVFKPFADVVGGASAVQAIARSQVPQEMRAEIIFGDGAGTDPRNRLSPRAAVRLLRALERELGASGHTLCDVLPVAGIDPGTLEKRLDGPLAGRVVGKTGTFGSYGASALVGAVDTRDRGTVYFAILNHGIPVPEARRRQDRFVRVLLGELDTTPWPYHLDAQTAVARAQVEVLDRAR